jgi:putative glycosyltransferase (TIGR04348 family)
VTALRWAGILRRLGHLVRIDCSYTGQNCDALLAIHAVKSAAAIAEYKRVHPTAGVIVALTGTDVFQDGSASSVLHESLRISNRIVTLQNQMAAVVPTEYQQKVRVIFQSFVPPVSLPKPDAELFEVCVLGHLRDVKDPFLTAKAVRNLPGESRIRVVHVGGALEPQYAELARQEETTNQRYRWLGERPRSEAVQAMARCQVLVMSSKSEGGPSAVSEAIVCGVPVLSTPTSGVVGLLGENYPGYFPFGDFEALKVLLVRCETDRQFHAQLGSWCDSLRPLIQLEAEQTAWAKLLAELGVI